MNTDYDESQDKEISGITAETEGHKVEEAPEKRANVRGGGNLDARRVHGDDSEEQEKTTEKENPNLKSAS